MSVAKSLFQALQPSLLREREIQEMGQKGEVVLNLGDQKARLCEGRTESIVVDK
jgi:hypothetical protein